MSTEIRQNQLTDDELVKSIPGFKNGYATVNGIKLHYVTGGKGSPLVLLPGWPQTWWSWHKVLPILSEHFTVIVADLRGMGGSEKPDSGYDKKTMAGDIAGLVKYLGYDKVSIAGHDIGSMVAYSVAANYPEIVEKLIMVDSLHPEDSLYTLPLFPAPGTFGDGKKANEAAPYLWWFAFHQVKGLPEQMLQGRFHLEQDWFFSYLLKNDSDINTFDRAVYTNAYDSIEGIRAGNAWYQAFEQDIIDDRTYQISTPTLAIGGISYEWMKAVLTSKIQDFKIAKIETGHFPAEEKPEETAHLIIGYLE